MLPRLPIKKFPILMYHKIKLEPDLSLTVSIDHFEEQMLAVKEAGYTCLFFNELEEIRRGAQSMPEKPILITFDDGYENNLSHALPILVKLKMKATVFLPVKYIGKNNLWDNGQDPLMGWDDIKNADPNFLQFGIHCYEHKTYRELTSENMKDDIKLALDILRAKQVPFVRVLAYPYGAYPKEKAQLNELKVFLRENEFLFAVRIGNRLNPCTLARPYLLKRVDIKGSDNMKMFKMKLIWGREWWRF